jgi:hypothetical protein
MIRKLSILFICFVFCSFGLSEIDSLTQKIISTEYIPDESFYHTQYHAPKDMIYIVSIKFDTVWKSFVADKVFRTSDHSVIIYNNNRLVIPNFAIEYLKIDSLYSP